MSEIRALQIQTEAAKSLVLVCREIDAEDDQLLEDTLEGETDIKKVMAWVVRRIGEDEAAIDALSAYIKVLMGRKERLESRVDKSRAALAKAMGECQLKKASLYNATLSLRELGPKLIIEDAILPSTLQVESQEYQLQVEVVSVKTDRKLVGELAKQGIEIPGVRLVPQPPSISIRMS